MVENAALQEVWIERTRRRGLVGNIYQGQVVRVLPGMEAAFIDIGLQRAAFLHVSDIAGSHVMKPEAQSHTAQHVTNDALPAITEVLHEGDQLLVQVIKDPLGTKGARLSTHLTIASRYLVLMPRANSIGVSIKIDDEAERERLRSAVEEIMADMPAGGYIVRTAAETAAHAALRRDIELLHKLWAAVTEQAAHAAKGDLVHEDLPLALRVLRDVVADNVEKILIDSRETYAKLEKFTAQFMPELQSRIQHYSGERPLFDIYAIEDEINRALEPKVQLKSGGYCIIDQTEAMTTIDVNTGAFVGHRNLEETIFKTNLEATQAIARQLRLRNLGGIIIIDFIDMLDEDHRRHVLRALERSLERDRAKTHVCGVSFLGLVEMTRKRTRESLEHVLTEHCPTCQGRGSIKTAETVCFEIFREILRDVRQFDARQLLVLAAQGVVDRLLDEESTNLAELEAFLDTPIRLQLESQYSQEQYDIVPM